MPFILLNIFNRLKRLSGISLVETLITVVIFSILVGGVYLTLTVGIGSWQANNVRVELQQELRKSMDWMIADLRQSGSSTITNVPADGNWYSTITFKTSSGVSGGNIVWSANTIQYIVGGNNSNQLQRINGAQTKIIAQSIQSLQIRRQASTSNIVEISMQAQKNTSTGHQITNSLNFEAELRN